MRLWFARDIWRYRNVFRLIDWLYALAVGAGAVRRNKRTATATDDEVKKEVVRYLHGAADRGGGRTRRHKTTAVTEQHHNVEVHFE